MKTAVSDVVKNERVLGTDCIVNRFSLVCRRAQK